MAGDHKDISVNCPSCGKQVTWSGQSEWRPFCSERCRLIDLGAWFSEERGIPGEETESATATDAVPPIDPGDVN
jgi:endogenous inhibitor of DNA gyrase (YacG/DUF329 family)